jgi:hypothetical protein
MKMGKRILSKQKGNSFERDVANFLSEHYNDKFSRVPQSGAIYGGQNRQRAVGVRSDVVEILTGDIITPSAFPFSLEAKSYKDIGFHSILQGDCKLLDEWISQAESDAQLSNKNFLIIMKFNHKGRFVCFRKDLIELDNDCCDNFMIYKGKYIFMTLEKYFECEKYINILKDWKEII